MDSNKFIIDFDDINVKCGTFLKWHNKDIFYIFINNVSYERMKIFHLKDNHILEFFRTNQFIEVK